MSQKDRKSNPINDIILILCGFLLLLLVPGMVALAAIRRVAHTNLDPGQMWSFAAVVSIVMWAVGWFLTKNFWRSLGYYVALSLLTLVGLLVGHFGLKAKFPQMLVSYYFPPDTTDSSTATAAKVRPADEIHLHSVQAIVEAYMRSRASNPSGLQFLEWSDLTTDGDTWAVTSRYRVQQPTALSTTATVRFQVRNGAVTTAQLIRNQ